MVYLVFDQDFGATVIAVNMEIWAILGRKMGPQLVLLKFIFYMDLSFFYSAFKRARKLYFYTIVRDVLQVSFVVHISIGKLSAAVLAASEFHLFQLVQDYSWDLGFNVSLLAHRTWCLRSWRAIRDIVVEMTFVICFHTALAVDFIARPTHCCGHPD